MKIIYNPPVKFDSKGLNRGGSPIKGFSSDGGKLPVYPGSTDGVQIPDGKMVQVQDDLADKLIETFGFLTEVSSDQALKMTKKEDKKEFVCEYCEDSFDHRVALVGHTRKHKKEIEAKNTPQIDESVIPVIKTSGVKKKQGQQNAEPAPDGKDGDGVNWYGGGMRESNVKVPDPGKGHFKGGLNG